MANIGSIVLNTGGGGSSSPITAGPASSTDNAIVRWDGVAGNDIQDSGVTISDTNVVSGATQLNVDNIRVDGNTISSTDTNGDVQIAPNGTGNLDVNGCNIELNASGTDIDVVLSTIARAGYGQGTLKIYSRDGVSDGHLECGSAWINGHSSGAGVMLRNGYYLAWANTLGDAADAGIGRTATNTLSIRGGYLVDPGKLLTARVVEAHTANDTLLSTESFSVHTNSGAAGEVILTLPTAAAGYVFDFYVMTAQQLQVKANTGDVIQLGTTGASAAAGYVRSATVGAHIRIESLDATNWYCSGIEGTWTIDS